MALSVTNNVVLLSLEVTMRNGSYETSDVNKVAGRLPGAREILREYHIDTSSQLRLREAALAASVEPDEMLAQIEARMRRMARPVEQPREKYTEERERVYS
jgi:iron-sulfur cluster repair protein YtfE (RIC family)